MKEFFTPYNVIRLLLLISGILFLALYIFVKTNGERHCAFLIIGLYSTAFANIMGVRGIKK